MVDDKESSEKPSFDFSFENNQAAHSTSDTENPDGPSDVIDLTDVLERGPGYKEQDEVLTLSDLDMALGQENPPESGEGEALSADAGEEMRPDEMFGAFESSAEDEDVYVLPEEPGSVGEAVDLDLGDEAARDPAGVSEARIEEIVERIVGETVERVARETMTAVAEKLIREAIDSLKQTIKETHD